MYEVSSNNPATTVQESGVSKILQPSDETQSLPKKDIQSVLSSKRKRDSEEGTETINKRSCPSNEPSPSSESLSKLELLKVMDTLMYAAPECDFDIDSIRHYKHYVSIEITNGFQCTSKTCTGLQHFAFISFENDYKATVVFKCKQSDYVAVDVGTLPVHCPEQNLRREDEGHADNYYCLANNRVKIVSENGDGYMWHPLKRLWLPITALNIKSDIGTVLERDYIRWARAIKHNMTDIVVGDVFETVLIPLGLPDKFMSVLRMLLDNMCEGRASESLNKTYKNYLQVIDNNKAKKVVHIMRERMNTYKAKCATLELFMLSATVALKTREASAIYQKAMPKLLDKSFVRRMNRDSPHDLPLKGGLLIDLRTGDIRERDEDDLFSFECPVCYLGPDADFKQIVKFFMSIAGDDKDGVYMHQIRCGYFLTGDVSDRSFFLDHGDGRNGKGTLYSMLQMIMTSDDGTESFFATTDKSTVVRRHQMGKGGPTPHLLNLETKRLIVTSEINDNEQLDEDFLKKWTSGTDDVECRGMYEKKMLTYRPVGKFGIQINELPKSNGEKALGDRAKVTSYPRRFVANPKKAHERKQDSAFIHLLKTKYMDEFFTWCVVGAIKFYNQGKTVKLCTRSQEATNRYINNMDNVKSFITDACNVCYTHNSDKDSKGASPQKCDNGCIKVTPKEFTSAYKRWCKDNSERPVRRDMFAQRLKDMGFEQKRVKEFGKVTRSWLGLEIGEDYQLSC